MAGILNLQDKKLTIILIRLIKEDFLYIKYHMKRFYYLLNNALLSLAILVIPTTLMAYEEANYKKVFQSDEIEVRFYEERLVVQTKYGDQDGGFRKLFNYISGSNKDSEKIAMTIPVTQLDSGDGMVMQFYLPSRFDKTNTPLPDDDSLEISSIQAGYYGVIQFSGRSKEKNFNKHSKILRKELEKNDIQIIGPSIKATYNGPFTLPRFRRNESMFLVNWDQ
tara:strand:- start:1051 stop:1716 length:666 start_codon:yes stop_codon:yes gene_type:complete